MIRQGYLTTTRFLMFPDSAVFFVYLLPNMAVILAIEMPVTSSPSLHHALVSPSFSRP